MSEDSKKLVRMAGKGSGGEVRATEKGLAIKLGKGDTHPWITGQDGKFTDQAKEQVKKAFPKHSVEFSKTKPTMKMSRDPRSGVVSHSTGTSEVTYYVELTKKDASKAEALVARIGEGTMGKTSTGKTVHHDAFHDSHREFTPDEHEQAAKMHDQEAAKVGSGGTKRAHQMGASHHRSLAGVKTGKHKNATGGRTLPD